MQLYTPIKCCVLSLAQVMDGKQCDKQNVCGSLMKFLYKKWVSIYKRPFDIYFQI